MVKRVPGPDALEKGLRFGCGAMLGAFAGGGFVLQYGYPPSLLVWSMLGGGVLLFGLLALRYGDRFWEGFATWWAGWWPW